ncbi:hypothetical protein ACFWY9_28260 [Amycolatopsis sp. NPDC059027]|uniref:hypothetical protein n=1 Tax=unclassified Amycolatopsis TaxID=2618356 RepID=UPI003670E364
MNRRPDRSRPTGSPKGWPPARILSWVFGGLLTLVTGTLVLGVVIHSLFRFDAALFPPYAIGFVLTAAYLAWLVSRAVRRTKHGPS